MELLLSKGYEVYGLVRRLSVPNTGNIQHILDRVTLIDGDLIDQSSLNAAVKEAAPDEIYSLAAQSFVATSFVQPVLTGEITGLGGPPPGGRPSERPRCAAIPSLVQRNVRTRGPRAPGREDGVPSP